MTSTKIEADKFKQYFGCIHRYSATSTRPKCTGTGIYDLKDGAYNKRKEHLKDCGIEEGSQIAIVNNSCAIQKEFLLAREESKTHDSTCFRSS